MNIQLAERKQNNDHLLIALLFAASAIIGIAIWHSGPTEISSLPNEPSQAQLDSPAQLTQAAAWSTMAFKPTPSNTPTLTPTVAMISTIGPTPLPYCATQARGICLLFQTINMTPTITPTVVSCRKATPSSVREVPCDKEDDGTDANNETGSTEL